MFVADRLIYLGLEKTGSTQIGAMLRAAVSGKTIGRHNRLEDRSLGKYIVGSIRNPWDWYVSLWAFGCSGRGALRRRIARSRRPGRPHGGSPTPASLWEPTYADCRAPGLFWKWLQLVFDADRRRDIGEGYASSAVAEIAGLLSYRYLRLYSRDLARVASGKPFSTAAQLKRFERSDTILDAVIRVERIESDFLCALSNAGCALDERQRAAVRSAVRRRRNTSNHLPTACYYHAEAVERVRDKERLIIEKFGYLPPG